MESQKILKIQQKFKENTIKKLKDQNKRYLDALKIIQKLIKENEELRSKVKSPTKKTKKKSPKSKSPLKKNNENTLNSNLEVKSLLKKYNDVLEKVLAFHLIIERREYLKDIEGFIKANKEEQNIILAEAVKMIQNYIKLDLNPENGINMDKDFIQLLKYLDNILSSTNPQENLESILEFVSEKPKKLFTRKDLSKVKTKLISLKETLNNNTTDIFKNTFLIDGKRLSLYMLYEKVDDCLELSQRKNPLIY